MTCTEWLQSHTAVTFLPHSTCSWRPPNGVWKVTLLCCAYCTCCRCSLPAGVVPTAQASTLLEGRPERRLQQRAPPPVRVITLPPGTPLSSVLGPGPEISVVPPTGDGSTTTSTAESGGGTTSTAAPGNATGTPATNAAGPPQDIGTGEGKREDSCICAVLTGRSVLHLELGHWGTGVPSVPPWTSW